MSISARNHFDRFLDLGHAADGYCDGFASTRPKSRKWAGSRRLCCVSFCRRVTHGLLFTVASGLDFDRRQHWLRLARLNRGANRKSRFAHRSFQPPASQNRRRPLLAATPATFAAGSGTHYQSDPRTADSSTETTLETTQHSSFRRGCCIDPFRAPRDYRAGGSRRGAAEQHRQGLDPTQDIQRRPIHHLTLGSRADTAGASQEQCRTQFGLQGRDLLTQRRLRHKNFLGST